MVLLLLLLLLIVYGVCCCRGFMCLALRVGQLKCLLSPVSFSCLLFLRNG